MSGRNLVNEMRSGSLAPKPPSRFPGALDLLLMSVALAAVAALGVLGFTTLVQPVLTPPVALVAQSPGSEQSLLPVDVAWTEADTSRCESLARSARGAEVPSELALADRTIAEGFSALAAIVACRLETKPTRFCNPEEKGLLVAMINDYLGRIDLLVLGLGVQGAPMAVAGAFLGGEAAMGSDIYDMHRESTLAFMTLHHQRVADDLRALARDGIITAADFGAFMGMGVPARIEKLLGGIPVERQACA